MDAKLLVEALAEWLEGPGPDADSLDGSVETLGAEQLTDDEVHSRMLALQDELEFQARPCTVHSLLLAVQQQPGVHRAWQGWAQALLQQLDPSEAHWDEQPELQHLGRRPSGGGGVQVLGPRQHSSRRHSRRSWG
ncbi:hypothetical protein HaLaN_07478, partial [Haematococcus lacustris]